MGTAVSIVKKHADASEDTDTVSQIIQNNNSRHKTNRKMKLFNTTEIRDVNPFVDEAKDPETIKLLTDALKDFFMFSEDESKIECVLKAMKHETFKETELLMVEGDPGTKLYIVASGQLEVTINGVFVRNMERGAMLGELALLYDAPRSATVKCQSDVSLWSLGRDMFKSAQAATVDALYNQRARWLVASPELAGLSAVDLSRLVNVMQSCTYKKGDTLYMEGVPSMRCMLITKGELSLFSSRDSKDMTIRDIDKMHGLYRPNLYGTTADDIPSRSASENSNGRLVAASQMMLAVTAVEVNSEHCQIAEPVDDQSLCGKDGSSRDVSECDSKPHNLNSMLSVSSVGNSNNTLRIANARKIAAFPVATLGEGSLVGFACLRGRAGLARGWIWKPGAGGVATFSASVASEQFECLEFTVDVFERLFGDSAMAIKLRRAGTTKVDVKAAEPQLQTFDPTKIIVKHCMGAGSFGAVTLAEYDGTSFALKTLGKAHLLDTGQLKHVLDERKLLSRMDCPFIVKLYGTYQTPHKIVFVTEVLQCGDLWSVIHEVPAHVSKRGLPPPLVVFYAASLVHALAYIHEHGIAYRDLKPENVMLDQNGYLRIIDFGFAKVIPYEELDIVTNEIKVHSKSYTLCGTPGMLSM